MSRMRILALDTTTRAGSVAVLEGNVDSSPPDAATGAHLLGVVATSSDEAYSTRLFRQLEFLLAELRMTTGDFDLFAVAAGPGSFTGLRVGLTAVKGWAEIHNRPIAAVSALEAIAFQVQRPRKTIVAVQDAGRGQIYGGCYVRESRDLRRIGDDVVMGPGEFWRHLHERTGGADLLFATPAAEFLASVTKGSPYENHVVVPVSRVLAPAVGQLGWAKALRGETCDALSLDAHYVRRSDAELLFKG